jgi:hypothetical protein
MKTPKDILKEYSNGHPDLKLNLFLECPEFRSEFIQMDLMKRSKKASHSKQKENESIIYKSA